MTEPGIVVIDVPDSASTDEAVLALNAPGDSYFLVQVLPVIGGHRAYLRRYKQMPTKVETAKDNAHSVSDTTAMSILRANRDKSVRTIVSVLDAAGIKRGRQWVCDQLTATCAEDGREDDAVGFVKRCGPGYTPRDVVEELRDIKIKRGLAWARQKLDEKRTLSGADNSKGGQERPPL
jgi:hypothetical protein